MVTNSSATYLMEDFSTSSEKKRPRQELLDDHLLEGNHQELLVQPKQLKLSIQNLENEHRIKLQLFKDKWSKDEDFQKQLKKEMMS